MNINWRKPTTIMVLLFIALFAWFLATEAKAETSIEAVPGVSWVGGDKYSGIGILLTERFSGKYDAGLMLMTLQQCGCKRGDYWGNMGLQAQRVVAKGRFELGAGLAYWANQTPAWNSNLTFSLHAGVTIGSAEVRWRHYSTGGSSLRNGGLDMLTLGWRFK